MTHPWNARPADSGLPAHWPLDEEDREYLGDYLWSLLLRGESDPAPYLNAVEEELPDVDETEAAAGHSSRHSVPGRPDGSPRPSPSWHHRCHRA